MLSYNHKNILNDCGPAPPPPPPNPTPKIKQMPKEFIKITFTHHAWTCLYVPYVHMAWTQPCIHTHIHTYMSTHICKGVYIYVYLCILCICEHAHKHEPALAKAHDMHACVHVVLWMWRNMHSHNVCLFFCFIVCRASCTAWSTCLTVSASPIIHHAQRYGRGQLQAHASKAASCVQAQGHQPIHGQGMGALLLRIPWWSASEEAVRLHYLSNNFLQIPCEPVWPSG